MDIVGGRLHPGQDLAVGFFFPECISMHRGLLNEHRPLTTHRGHAEFRPLNKHRPLTTHRGHAEFRPLTAHRGHVVIVTSFEISKCVRLYPCSRGVWFSLLSCLNRDQQGSQRLLRVHSTRVPPMVCLQSTYGSLLIEYLRLSFGSSYPALFPARSGTGTRRNPCLPDLWTKPLLTSEVDSHGKADATFRLAQDR